MMNKNKFIFMGLSTEVLFLTIDCFAKFAAHRTVTHMDTGVITQDLNYSLDTIWLYLLSIRDLYKIIDFLFIIILIFILGICFVGVIRNNNLIVSVSCGINLLFILVPTVFSFIYKESYKGVVIAQYKLTFLGYLIVLLALGMFIFSLINTFKKTSEKNTKKPNSNYTDELRELAKLLKENVITQEEFDEKKKRLLNL